jgi:hypothetical protein
MSRVAAPPAIRARVVEELRKPMPRPEVIREPEGGEIPVSSIVITRESRWRSVLGQVPLGRLAAAASLLLGAGLGVWLIGEAIRSGNRHFSQQTVALAPEDPEALPEIPVPADLSPLNYEAGPSVAVNLPEPGELVSEPLLVNEYGFPTALGPTPDDSGLTAKPTPTGMSPAEAVELARAGRLVIRVRSLSQEQAAQGVEQVMLQTSRELRWRPLEAWELPQVTLALRERMPEQPAFAAARPPSATQADAAEPKSELPAPQPAHPLGTSADVAAALRSADFRPLYTVELDESEGQLEALLERLAKNKGQVVEFVAIEEPLPTLMPSTDPAAVLWWRRAGRAESACRSCSRLSRTKSSLRERDCEVSL